MLATVEGVCLEVYERERDGKKEKVARVFQPGEKGTLDVAGLNAGEGERVMVKVRIFPYALGRDRIPSLALKVVEQ